MMYMASFLWSLSAVAAAPGASRVWREATVICLEMLFTVGGVADVGS